MSTQGIRTKEYFISTITDIDALSLLHMLKIDTIAFVTCSPL